jgi:hypothetical protein
MNCLAERDSALRYKEYQFSSEVRLLFVRASPTGVLVKAQKRTTIS